MTMSGETMRDQRQDRDEKPVSAAKLSALQQRITEGLASGLGRRSMAELREAALARIDSAARRP